MKSTLVFVSYEQVFFVKMNLVVYFTYFNSNLFYSDFAFYSKILIDTLGGKRIKRKKNEKKKF